MDKCLLLLSGGIDSPVAGWLARKQGLAVIALHYSMEPLTDGMPEGKAAAVCGRLGFRKLITANIAQPLNAIASNCQHNLYFVLMKRLMLRLAERVAMQEGCACIVTGDNLGQVSSQTLSNLATIDMATGMEVSRPLLGLEKNEITAMAERIGTFALSAGKEVCDVLGPQRPDTRSDLGRAVHEEAKLDLAAMEHAALASMHIVQFATRPRTAASYI